MNIGESVKLGKVSVTFPESVSLSDYCKLEDNVRLRVGGKYGIARIDIGESTFIGHSTQINVGSPIKIGRNCLIAPLTIFTDAHHVFSKLDIPINLQDCNYHPIVIEDNVWIGAGSIILGGVVIGEGAIVAAGSLVNKSIPSFEVWGGIPAKKIKTRINI
jgi:acetyltransferase-like isoleucine patch superfamily enzyme